MQRFSEFKIATSPGPNQMKALIRIVRYDLPSIINDYNRFKFHTISLTLILQLWSKLG